MQITFFDYPQLLWGMPGGTEWLLILLVVLLFFGGRKIPDLMRGLGKSVREFNEARQGDKKEIKNQPDSPEKTSLSGKKISKSPSEN